MRLSQSASVSSKWRKDQRLGSSRTRKKHKRLDAICEKAYNRNRGVEVGLNGVVGGMGSPGVDAELRRSSRVRRAPVVLDASPLPVKKRPRIDKSAERLSAHVERVKGESSSKGHSPCESFGDADEPARWNSRLRSRVRNVGCLVKEKRESPRGKRKLFEDLKELKEELTLEERETEDKKEELDGRKSTVMKSKRPGRIKAASVSENEDKEIELNTINEDENERNEVETAKTKDEGLTLVVEGRIGYGNEGESEGHNDMELIEEEDSEVQNELKLQERIVNDSVETVEKSDKELEQLESEKEKEKEVDHVDVVVVMTSQVEERLRQDAKEASFVKVNEKHLEYENTQEVDETNCASVDKLSKLHIKEGRRCGLCGGGTDGKPPKRLLHDTGESEIEACSVSSASEEPNYDVWDGFGDESGWLGRLLGPINDRFGIAGIWVHQHCAVWSPEVYFAGLGCLKNVRAALCRGRVLKCSRCGRPGATIGCRVDRCPKTYHLPCARANGCHFDHRKFLIACTDHRHLFQPHGNQYIFRIKKMKAKKMKLEMRKLSSDAWRKDHEAEEKWLENCGEDEEFLKRESKRLHRDLLRIAPVYIGGSNSGSEKLFQGWESVAGLQDVIRCMKEVVILPLLYPEFFNNLGLTPPRGVLLHGYPGTGKTLVVRALIGSCARGDKRIAYFARKGADCLGKYVGDAERQLRLLFQVAERSQPSIIFFDEIDGLAPRRTRQQDQTHSSVVSTLLALLDGLKSRGSVVVIGATNRPEAVDPALRRPGRFDREIYFPLPSVKDRASILSLHTQRWPKPVTGSLLKWIARKTAGFAGADLQALCTQAAMIALKRNCPFQKLLSAAGKRALDGKRLPLPAFMVDERDWLEALACAPPPCSRREAGMAANDVVSSPIHTHLIPCLLQPLSCLLVSLYLDECIWLPPPLFEGAAAIKSVIVSALNRKNVPIYFWWSHVQELLQEADVAREVEKNLSRAGILMGEASLFGYGSLNEVTDSSYVVFEPSKVHHDGSHSSSFQNISLSSGKKSGFRILIAGSPKSGQRHLASCLLHCFAGNVEIWKVDLATISQEGQGDMVQGVTQILMKCASVGSCMVYLPRFDLWALESCHQVSREECDSSSTDRPSCEDENYSCSRHCQVANKGDECCLRASKSADTAKSYTSLRASHAWSSFVEQVESLCVATSLMILATSEAPCPALPPRVKQFFQGNVLGCGHSTSSVGTIPRFIVQVDGNFNHDAVINSSAAELARDLIQSFVQLIHHKTHIDVSSYKDHNVLGTIQDGVEVICHGVDPGSADGPDGKSQHPNDANVNVPHPAYSRPAKGKSSLLLAMSIFGYQILRYPHFAELCWVTSKLKEGPCADVNGPWKGWPFNTCIVRPGSPLERVAVACSGSVKGKEKCGLVRGLIAVGLSAYRGVYTSLRQVSSEVRKVLELLVGHINAKIQGGKDRCQFIRILSQVAYLEDVVNSWAYALQSLELDAQMLRENPKLSTVGSPDNHCNGDSHELKEQEESAQGLAAVSTGCVYVDMGDGNFNNTNAESKLSIPEVPHLRTLSDSTPVTCLQSSAMGPFNGNILNKQNGAQVELLRSENSGNCSMFNGDCGSLRHANGFAVTESVDPSEDGVCSSGDFCGIKGSSSRKVPGNLNGLFVADVGVQSKDGTPNSCDEDADLNFSWNKTSTLPAGSEVVCLYCCCSGCLYTLHSLMQKILIHEWELNVNHQSVEDVHDVVTSLSLNLLSELGKLNDTGSLSSFVDEKSRNEKHEKIIGRNGLGACKCRNLSYCSVMPMECGCHSESKSSVAKANPLNFPTGLVSKFIYRNGVLVPVDLDEDVPLHCKFETFCLCSLIEWIVWTKTPLD